MDQSQFNGTVTGCLKKIKNKKNCVHLSNQLKFWALLFNWEMICGGTRFQ